MKKFAWLISILLLVALAFQMPYSKVKTVSTQKENTKQYVVKEETPSSSSAIKLNLQFSQSTTTPLSLNNTTQAVLYSNRLMDTKFIQQRIAYHNIKPVLYTPTYLKVRVLRL